MRPERTVLSSIGVLTVSTRRVVIVMLRSHSVLQMQVDLGCRARRRSRWCRPARRSPGRARRSPACRPPRSRRRRRAAGQLHDLLRRPRRRLLLISRVAPNVLRHLEPVVVEVDHDDLRRRIELRGQQRREADRAGADDGHRARPAAPCRSARRTRSRSAGCRSASRAPLRRRRRESDRGWCRRAECARTRPACRRCVLPRIQPPVVQCEYMPRRQ